jgi:formate C-acetyltransferase
MTDTISKPPPAAETAAPPFAWGLWSREIDVRDFIQQHVTPYDGDESFLAGPTARTTALWDQLQALFLEERKKGVLDISQIPSTIIAHEAGYIDKDNEVIVGLQTEAPLKRAIMPNGGFRMVLTSLKTYGYEPDPAVVETFSKYRKTHNEGVFDAYTEAVRRCRSSHVLTGLPDAYGRGGSSATTAGWRSTAWTG